MLIASQAVNSVRKSRLKERAPELRGPEVSNKRNDLDNLSIVKVKSHLGPIDDETPAGRGRRTSSSAPKIWITAWMALLSHLQVKSYTGGTTDKSASSQGLGT